MLQLKDIISKERIVDISAQTKIDALHEMVSVIATSENITNQQEFLDSILEREGILSTGIGIGVAIPHAKISSVKGFVVAIGRSMGGINFDSLDGRPVYLIILIGGPDDKQHEYLRMLAKVSSFLKDPEIKEKMMKVKNVKEIYEILAND